MNKPRLSLLSLLSSTVLVKLLVFNITTTPSQAFVPPPVSPAAGRSLPSSSSSSLKVSELERQQQKKQQEREQQEQDELAAKTNAILSSSSTTQEPLRNKNSGIPRTLRVPGQGIPSRQEKVQLLDSSTYESYITKTWETDPTVQRGFDWEIEKLRRYAAGLRMREDGTWVKQPSVFDFLVSPSRYHRSAANNVVGPPAAGLMDSAKVFGAQFLTGLGFGSALGMAAVPNAVIQKYEGSFLSFIKGVLGGDLQTLAGGPLFLLLAKYFDEYGPIFNLSL